MANEEHLALLRQGVDGWNAWKANNPEIRPDLSFATGKGLIIREAKLSGVDLSRANLSRANLSRADLIGANLSAANLSEAYLSEADLIGANLNSADFSRADLIGANLIGANLNGAYLSGADLSKANLSGADLIGAKLIGAKLSGTNLSGANLTRANLIGAYLRGANLRGATLNRANFSRTNLSKANLQRTKALNTNFNKAILTEACLEDWHINSGTNLDKVICDYVYLQTNQQERFPTEGSFAPGEFTQLFQKTLEAVELTFRNGIDWQAFLTSFQKLQVESGDLEVFIQAIENQNNGVLIIRLNVPPDVNKGEIENYLKQEYKAQLKAIDKEYRYHLQATYEQIAIHRQQSANLAEIVKRMAGRTINVEARAIVEHKAVLEACKDDPTDTQVSPFVDTERGSLQEQSIQPTYVPEQKQNLIDTAIKIQKLLQQLEQIYPINTPLEKQMVVTEVIKRIEENPTLKAWVVGALKGVGIEALKHLIDHPLVNVLLAALEGYQEVDILGNVEHGE
ncbi:MAG TPA: pentapeptide repeat-containing protein [Coleofasciculaceae cyanobacterium]